MFEYLFQINVQLSDPFTPRLHDVVVYSDWSSDDPELQRLMATWATTLAAMDSTGPCAEHRTSEDEEVGRVANSGVSKPGKKSHVCFGGPFFRRHITVRCFKLYIYIRPKTVWGIFRICPSPRMWFSFGMPDSPKNVMLFRWWRGIRIPWLGW